MMTLPMLIQKIFQIMILCGGFPCQSFSIACYRKGLGDKGRGDLIFNVIDIMKSKKTESGFLRKC